MLTSSRPKCSKPSRRLPAVRPDIECAAPQAPEPLDYRIGFRSDIGVRLRAKRCSTASAKGTRPIPRAPLELTDVETAHAEYALADEGLMLANALGELDWLTPVRARAARSSSRKSASSEE